MPARALLTMQHIPEEEGGPAGSATFEGPGADREDSRRQIAGAVGTGNGASLQRHRAG